MRQASHPRPFWLQTVRLSVGIGFLCLASISANSQVRIDNKAPGEDTRNSEINKKGQNVTLGKIPTSFVKPQRAKAVITGVDLDARTVTVVPTSSGGSFRVAEVTADGRSWSRVQEMTLDFVPPQGSEKIRASGKAAKQLGKKGLLLKDIPNGARVEIDYYPAGPTARELMVQSIPQSK